MYKCKKIPSFVKREKKVPACLLLKMLPHTAVETDLTFGLTPNRPSHPACSSEAPEERSSRRLADSESLGRGAQQNTDLEREDSISRGRRSPSKPDFLYKKSAL